MGRFLSLVFVFFLSLFVSGIVLSDDMRPGYLHIKQSTDNEFNVLFKVPAKNNNQRLSLQVAFDETVIDKTQKVSRYVENNHFLSWQVMRPNLIGMQITIEGLAKTNSEILLHIEALDGGVITHRFTSDQVSYTIEGKQTWGKTVWTYFVLGVEHILLGFDHLLFVFALLLLVEGRYRLITTITAFTLAHSITLVLSSLKLVVLPIPPVEACIALSIVFVAVEVIHKQQGRYSLSASKPWTVAFAFGLLHGLGFAAVLEEIGLPENAFASALVFFNVGVEVGQLIFVLALLIAAYLLSRFLPAVMKLNKLPPYAIGSLASFWLLERVFNFWIV